MKHFTFSFILSCILKNALFSFSLITNKIKKKEVNWYSVNVFLFVCVEAKAAPELCFKDVNSKGDRFGNCGYQSNGFKKCESRYSTARYTALQFNYNSHPHKNTHTLIPSETPCAGSCSVRTFCPQSYLASSRQSSRPPSLTLSAGAWTSALARTCLIPAWSMRAPSVEKIRWWRKETLTNLLNIPYFFIYYVRRLAKHAYWSV